MGENEEKGPVLNSDLPTQLNFVFNSRKMVLNAERELEIACNRDLEWTGEYVTDYKALLPGGSHYQPPSEGGGDEEELGDMSLVSGRMRGMGLNSSSGSGELMVVNDKTVASLHEGGGGQYLATKSWSGLEQKLGATMVTGVVEGTIGIAAGYEKEPS